MHCKEHFGLEEMEADHIKPWHEGEKPLRKIAKCCANNATEQNLGNKTNKNMDKNLTVLKSIGLQSYLEKRGGGVIYPEPHVLAVNHFVEGLPGAQKEILKEKISQKERETHIQLNNIFHEICVACALYENVEFLPEDQPGKHPDFKSGDINVEVKSINNSDEERARQDYLAINVRSCKIKQCLNTKKTEEWRVRCVNSVNRKFQEHVNKAKEQLRPEGGEIWIVYTVDWPLWLPKERFEEIKKEIENSFNALREDPQSKKYRIEYIHFGSLRNKLRDKLDKHQQNTI